MIINYYTIAQCEYITRKGKGKGVLKAPETATDIKQLQHFGFMQTDEFWYKYLTDKEVEYIDFMLSEGVDEVLIDNAIFPIEEKLEVNKTSKLLSMLAILFMLIAIMCCGYMLYTFSHVYVMFAVISIFTALSFIMVTINKLTYKKTIFNAMLFKLISVMSISIFVGLVLIIFFLGVGFGIQTIMDIVISIVEDFKKWF